MYWPFKVCIDGGKMSEQQSWEEVRRKEKDEGFHFIWEMDELGWHFHRYRIKWWKILVALGQNGLRNWVGSGVAVLHSLIGFLCSILFYIFFDLFDFSSTFFFFIRCCYSTCSMYKICNLFSGKTSQVNRVKILTNRNEKC